MSSQMGGARDLIQIIYEITAHDIQKPVINDIIHQHDFINDIAQHVAASISSRGKSVLKTKAHLAPSAPSAGPPSSPGPRHGFYGTEPTTAITLATPVVTVVACAPYNLIINMLRGSLRRDETVAAPPAAVAMWQ